MPVAAIVAAGALTAGATIYASNKAASATKQATQTAVDAQQKAAVDQAALSAPYRQLGESAIPEYQKLLGLGGGADKSTIMQTLQSLPGYEFTRSQGLDAAKAQAAAMGLGLSGNTLAALEQYGSGLASQTYGQRLGELQQAVGMGQAAAAGQAANVGQTASNLSNLATNQGTNLANINIGGAAGVSGAINNALNQYTLMNTLKGLGGTGGGLGGLGGLGSIGYG